MSSDVLSPPRPRTPGARQPVPDARRPVKPGRGPRPGSPGLPKSPVRPASPVRPPGPGRSDRPVTTGAAGVGQVGQVRRTSFVLLLLGLLGGGLVCLLVVNTTLAANSIEISKWQKQNAVNTEQVQELQQQVAAARSATTIAKEARRLGMRPDPELIFINLGTKSIEAPRGAAAAALAARLAAGFPARGRAGTGTRAGAKSAAGGPGQ